MEIWVDSADVEDVKKAMEFGVVDGATTNPTLFAQQESKDFVGVVKELCEIVKGPVSAEVVATDYRGMCEEAEKVSSIHENVVVKIPCTQDGLRAVKYCSGKGIKTNFTLTFSPNQVLLAAKAGATYTNIFIGRLDDVGIDGMEAVRESVAILEKFKLDTKLIAASVRHPLHVKEAALAGCHVATVPPAVIEKMLKHPFSDAGLKSFLADWEKFGGKIGV